MARHRLTEWLGATQGGPELVDATLLVSELVTNAVVHGRGRIELRARLRDDRLRVDVTDDGQGFARDGHRPDGDGAGGRGLAIVDAYASAWGIDPGRTNVWFELTRRPPPR